MSDGNDFRRDPTRTAETFAATPGIAFVEAPPPGLIALGATFGRYRIVELLGVGGLGEVYRARDTHLQRDVALKLVRPSANDAKFSADRVLREARAAATLVHPNIVQIFDVGEIDGVPFLAMELIEGVPLRAYIGKDEPPIAKRIAWLITIAHALDAAHRQGIVHRDVKPDNVMIREDGIVKVVDFGIAHIGDEAKRTITISRKGIAIGTPAYMAPEQLRGERVDARTDQFAWGVLAYELLDGSRPWSSSDLVSLIGQIANAEFQISSRIPGAMRGVLSRSLSKSVEARYRSMSELISAIETSKILLRAREPVNQWRPEARRKSIEFRRDVNLAVLQGDLEAADRLALSWEDSLSQEPDEMQHLSPLRIRAYVALETGHPGRAVRIAQEYLRRQPAWAIDDFEAGTRIHALVLEYLAGALSRETFRKEQAGWLEQEQARARKNARNESSSYLWLIGYAPGVKDKVDAERALQILPQFQPVLSPADRGVGIEWWIGRAYRLSGRPFEARQSLGWAVRSCEAINFPFEQTWSIQMLATVLEEAGDTAGACTHYARVVSRWGRSVDSISVRDARAGLRRLNCTVPNVTSANANSTTRASALPR